MLDLVAFICIRTCRLLASADESFLSKGWIQCRRHPGWCLKPSSHQTGLSSAREDQVWFSYLSFLVFKLFNLILDSWCHSFSLVLTVLHLIVRNSRLTTGLVLSLAGILIYDHYIMNKYASFMSFVQLVCFLTRVSALIWPCLFPSGFSVVFFYQLHHLE